MGVRAISACVPKNVERITQLTNLFSREEMEKFTQTTGIKERRIISSESICTSDLCFAAAERLLEENKIDRNSIDMLLFMTQGFDYISPATSPILQHRLGLPNSTACLDLTLACSGWVYALSTAIAFCSTPTINRVLVLVGDVSTRTVDKNDSSFWPLVGDAGTATLVEKGDYGEFFFDLVTFGESYQSIMIPGSINGRNPVHGTGYDEKDTKAKLEGMDVFSFAISQVPKSMRRLYENSGVPQENIDEFLFHQANAYIIKSISKKLKLPCDKVPMNIDRFGNTSMAAIPLLMSTELCNSSGKRNWLMSGFGAGLSVGTCIGSFEKCIISKLVEFE
ncbi:MAG: ketoacyl-ACP synthase III [Treponema sp.]|nr:ketoacyl-ACP synthase III [Treponema sp.]